MITIFVEIPENTVYNDYSANILFSAWGYQVELPIKISVQQDILFEIVSFANIQLPKFEKSILGVEGIPLWFWGAVIVGIVVLAVVCQKKKVFVRERDKRVRY